MRKAILLISEAISLKILVGKKVNKICGIMATCKWCGRYFKDGKGYNSSFFELRQKYCSKRCYLEHEASKNPQQIYYGQEPVRHSGGGFWSFIKKVIKWAIIIFIALIVLALITSK